MSLWSGLRRAVMDMGEREKDTATAEMQTPTETEKEGIDFDEPKDLHKVEVETRNESCEDEVYVLLYDCMGALLTINPSSNADVQASVSDTDEDLPVNTFRAWFLGIIGTVVLTALNQFFQLHSPPRKLQLTGSRGMVY